MIKRISGSGSLGSLYVTGLCGMYLYVSAGGDGIWTDWAQERERGRMGIPEFDPNRCIVNSEKLS